MTVSTLLICSKESSAPLSVIVSTSSDGGATWTAGAAATVGIGESGTFDVTKNQQHLTLAPAAEGSAGVEVEAQGTQEKVLAVTMMAPGVTAPANGPDAFNKTKIGVTTEYQSTALIEEA